MNSLRPFLLPVACALALSAQAADDTRSPKLINDYYQVETIDTPAGLSPEIGALGFMPDGRLVIGFHRGEIYTYEPNSKKWTLFAAGIHDPLGVVALSDKEIVVMQRPELTKIIDTDGDGVGDQFDTITDDFGLTGNYHEFAFGPLRAPDGSYFIALNCASSGAGMRYETRGQMNPLSTYPDRMYSSTPYRGWVARVTPDGKFEPYALGFRSPNGLGFDGEGNLFVPDNQGDWIGTSPLYHVQKGNFYGHPASLAWKEGISTSPTKIAPQELNEMRTMPAIQFPQNLVANSITQPLLDSTGGQFGPFGGQMLIGDMNHSRLLRLIFDKVDGQIQGACVPWIDHGGLRKGNNRLAFGPDGSLWVGQTDHGWPGEKGLQRVTWTGKVPLEVKTIKLTKTGFDLTFTKPVDPVIASQPSSYKLKRYYYEYHLAYGSKQYDLEEVPIKSVTLSPDGKSVSIELNDLKAWRIYEWGFDALKTADGAPLVNPLLCYTLNHLLENTPPRPPAGISKTLKDGD